MKVIENPEFNGLELYFDGKPNHAVIGRLKDAHFRWHNKKKCWFAKNNEKNRALVESLGGTVDSIPLSTKSAQAPTNKFGVQVGDIFYISWGYDQTNVNFFQVVALVGAVSVRIKEIHYDHVRTESYMSGYVVPVKDKFSSCGIFIKDLENGDLKKVQPYSTADGRFYIKVKDYYADPTTETAEHFKSTWA